MFWNLDITFCPFYDKCNRGSSCRRALDESIRTIIDKENIHISVFMEKPDDIDSCFYPKGDS